jgi:hypothetical protein
MKKVLDIPDLNKRRRKRLQKAGVHQKLHYKVSVLYAHHKKKPSAAIATQMCADFMRVLNTGAVPDDCEAEYIEGGERLQGGTATSREKPLAGTVALCKSARRRAIVPWLLLRSAKTRTAAWCRVLAGRCGACSH